MIIAQISDTHLALDSGDADQRIGDFERAVADINALDPPADVIVHTGDIVHNGRGDEYTQAVRILAKARAPVYVMAGNKDAREPLRAAFAGQGYLAPDTRFIDYAIEDFPVRIVALDTLDPGSNRGGFCAERVARLTELVDAETTRPIAVFTHHPPFEVLVGPDPIHFHSLDAMEALRRALQRSGRVVGVFSGHVHRAAFGRVGDIPASVVQCVATPLRKGDYPAAMTGRPIYQVHRFDPVWGFATETRIAGGPSAPQASDPVQARLQRT